MERRTFLLRSGALAGLTAAGCGTEEITPRPTPQPRSGSDFVALLPIPAENHGAWIGGRRVYSLTIQAGETEFFSGYMAPTTGYNGALLGPTIRARRGEPITIYVKNELNVESTTHWHGAHLPASADGGPHQVIPPGGVWVSEWTIDQQGCTNWYHPHREGTTAEQVYFGLAGFFIIDDEAHDALDLPRTYGVDDLPIVVQDRRFTPTGELEYELTDIDKGRGFVGDYFLVNGAIKPFYSVPAKQIRLRLLNGSNARVYRFAFSDESEFQLIGGDNSLLEAPELIKRVLLSPGERAEIVVDLSARLNQSLLLVDELEGVELLELNVSYEALTQTVVPPALITLDRHDPDQALRNRSFDLTMMGGFKINGREMDLTVLNETITVDELETWVVRNRSMTYHNFHMHGHYFEVISRNGEGPRVHEQGYKDTVFLEGGDEVRLAVKHVDYTDNTYTYMYHCHILEHEDQGMMGQFMVVEPSA